MSVFKKIKGTFQTAQQGFVGGLRAVTLFDGHFKSEHLHHIKSKDINLDVGADLLHEYQEVWSSIQNETKLCSKKAETVDVNLAPMFVLWDKRAESVAALEEEVKSIPAILSVLKKLHTLLETVRQDFSVVESSLSMLDNVCEDLDLKKAMEEETKKLNNYKKMKEKEAEKIKIQLALEHARRMQDIESSKSMKLKERAEAFTSAFEEDIDYYKTHGQPESKLVTEFPKVTSLSQIDIVDDRKDLDTFLGPQTEEEPEAGAGEQYFEDDYTADFSVKVKEDLEGPEEDEDLKPFIPNENDDHSNDENENVIQGKGNYPDSYLVKNEDIDIQEDLDEEQLDNTGISQTTTDTTEVKDEIKENTHLGSEVDSDNLIAEKGEA